MSNNLTFDLTVACEDIESLTDFLTTIFNNGGTLVNYVAEGEGAQWPEFTIRVPDEIHAYAILDNVYGPDNGTRDSNHFFVYGND